MYPKKKCIINHIHMNQNILRDCGLKIDWSVCDVGDGGLRSSTLYTTSE